MEYYKAKADCMEYLTWGKIVEPENENYPAMRKYELYFVGTTKYEDAGLIFQKQKSKDYIDITWYVSYKKIFSAIVLISFLAGLIYGFVK